ncbi:MAG: hypothetical protein M1839_002883 [Geoglossum umbratile]|nr:MAG: hypothetical protein M1839_002883 [Geoglossum umbratile]
MLASLQPGQAVVALNERVKRVGKINLEIADWLQERRRVEESYVQGLKKLARKQPPDETSDLGIFYTPWQKIVSSTESLAASHATLAQKIEADIERPLREYATKDRDMQAMSTIQGNLSAMAKEVEAAQEKAEKLKKKGAKAPAAKVADATSGVETATSHWDSQAPYVFERLQSVDESRLNHLRDLLTQFQTHEVDQVERNRVTAEETLNVILNVETADEIKNFAARTASGKPKVERQRSRTTTGSTLSPPTPSLVTDETASQRSGGSGGNEPRPDRFSGLKRLGTVMGRRRQSIYGRASSPDKRSTDRFGGFTRTPRDAPPMPSPPTSSSNLPASPQRENRRASFQGESPSKGARRGSKDTPNGENIGPAAGRSASPTPVNGSGFDEIQSTPEAPSNPSVMVTGEKEQKDSEGFSLPPPGKDPISQAEQEANENAPAPQFKLDIRNDPIQEEDGDANEALANVANTLRLQAAPNRKGTVRGRRDVRNTIFVPSPQSPETPGTDSPPSTSPFKQTRTATLSSDDHVGSDTQSIRSSRSLSSLTSTAAKHPDLHEPGLNSSLIETVSAWFDQGRATKAVVIGELALAYNPVDITVPFGTETIRLENFPVLEKVAPNPTFISQTPEKAGEYGVNLSSIIRTAVAFKYQVHLEDSTLSTHAPFTLTPAWKHEPTKTSVILTYAFNPPFTSADRGAVTLHNLIIIIGLEGAKATACQSKPVGNFSKEKSIIYWRLGDVTLEADGAPGKLIARFTTDQEAKPGSVEARWEIVGDNAIGLGSGLQLSQLSTISSAIATTSPTEADPFADEGVAPSPAPSPSVAWKDVPMVRRIVSGKYIAV